jgi:hypothetical protein
MCLCAVLSVLAVVLTPVILLLLLLLAAAAEVVTVKPQNLCSAYH